MRLGSLFTGIGGVDLAAERAGIEVVVQSEIDKYASRILAHHWPDTPNYGDIHNIGTDQLAGLDILAGGFPCQDYSVAGTRDGLAGDRGALWWEFHRLIDGARPTWVVGENVAGLLSSRGGADFETIITSLVQLGYGVVWGVLDAQYFGVAQRRRRVFIVGHLGGLPRPEILALGEGLFGHPAPSRESREETAGPTPIGIGGGDLSQSLTTHKGGLSAKQNQFALVVEEVPPVAVTVTTRTGARYDAETETLIPYGFNSRQDPIGIPNLSIPVDSTSPHAAAVAFAQNQREEVRILPGVAGALAAEPGMKQQTYVTEPSVRRLTPTECERLQGFPDGWTAIEGNSDTQRYRQLGNAVAVPVVEWILRRIAGA